MKKFVTLFTDSYKEMKSVRTITTAAMFGAISIIMGFYSIYIGNFIRIGFSSIPNGMLAYLFGPVVGALFTGSLDILNYLLKPVGAFFPGFTLVAMLKGVLYGCLYYKKSITLSRVLVTKFLVMLICNVILNTLCISVLYGKGFLILLPVRALKNLVIWPIDSLIFYSMLKALDTMGVFRIIRPTQTAGTK